MLTKENYYLQRSIKLPLDRISKIFKIVMPIYWAFLTYMLLRPSSGALNSFNFFDGIDKVVHFFIFAILSFCFWATFPKMAFWKFLLLTLFYALLTEILQGVMGLGRSMEFWDLIADTLGLIFGYILFRKTKLL